MKIKVSNYIAKKLVENQISQVFTVTGGGAMHLNDARASGGTALPLPTS